MQPTTGDSASFMPLDVGNYWVWSQSLVNEQGEITYSEIDSLAILVADSVAGEVWFKASNWYYYIERANGLWWSKQETSTPSQLYKSPVSVGETYSLVDEFGKTVYYSVLDTDAGIHVPAGSFNCWKFHINCPSCGITDTVWIAPDLGEVRTIALLPDGSRHERKLIRFFVQH